MGDVPDNTAITRPYQDGAYLENNNDWHAGDSPWKASQIEKIIARNQLELESICEIGCGAGEILRQLSMKPRFESVSFSGYEISQVAYELCKTRESEKVRFYHEDLLSKDVNFDAILCIDVFEHVENYMGFLKALNKKAAYKIFHIPLDLSVSDLLRGTVLRGRESVGHLHYFTPDIALATLKDCGYEIIDTMYTPVFEDFSSNTVKAKIARLPRMLLYRISPHLLSTLIGGVSLMVLAK